MKSTRAALLLAPLAALHAADAMSAQRPVVDCRLWFGPVQHAHHHNARRVDVHRQLELPVLELRVNLACGLLSAGLRVRTRFACIHSLGDVATSLRVRQHSCYQYLPDAVVVILDEPNKPIYGQKTRGKDRSGPRAARSSCIGR